MPIPRGMAYPNTPDGRYFVVRNRLWRRSNPALTEAERQVLVQELMAARRAIRQALKLEDDDVIRIARDAVNSAKVALGERGPVWWDDGAPDLNRQLVSKTRYSEWFALLSADEPAD